MKRSRLPKSVGKIRKTRLFTLDKKMPANSWLEFHYVMEGEHLESLDENVSGKTMREVLAGIMREARIGNFDYVYWEGLYSDDKKIAGHKFLVDMAVEVSK